MDIAPPTITIGGDASPAAEPNAEDRSRAAWQRANSQIAVILTVGACVIALLWMIMSVVIGTERAYLGNMPIMLGGDLIVAIDDQKVEDEQDLAQVMNNHRAGDTVKITIYRNKKKMDVSVALGEARQQV